MTTTTLTLADFLLARVAEDEAQVERGRRHNAPEVYANDNYGCLLVDPARVLAECVAKRAIVELHAPFEAYRNKPLACVTCVPTDDCGGYVIDDDLNAWPCPTLRTLASVYADHPDYDPAWA